MGKCFSNRYVGGGKKLKWVDDLLLFTQHDVDFWKFLNFTHKYKENWRVSNKILK